MLPLVYILIGAIIGIAFNESPKIILKQTESVIDNVRKLIKRGKQK